MAKQPQRSHQQSNSTNQHKSKKFDFVEVDFELLNWRSAAPPPTNHSQTKLKFVLFIHWWRWAGQPAFIHWFRSFFSSSIHEFYFYNIKLNSKSFNLKKSIMKLFFAEEKSWMVELARILHQRKQVSLYCGWVGYRFCCRAQSIQLTSLPPSAIFIKKTRSVWSVFAGASESKGQTSWNEIKDLSFMEWNGCAAEGPPAHNPAISLINQTPPLLNKFNKLTLFHN